MINMSSPKKRRRLNTESHRTIAVDSVHDDVATTSQQLATVSMEPCEEASEHIFFHLYVIEAAQ
jgi:hypothetical protein